MMICPCGDTGGVNIFIFTMRIRSAFFQSREAKVLGSLAFTCLNINNPFFSMGPQNLFSNSTSNEIKFDSDIRLVEKDISKKIYYEKKGPIFPVSLGSTRMKESVPFHDFMIQDKRILPLSRFKDFKY